MSTSQSTDISTVTVTVTSTPPYVSPVTLTITEPTLIVWQIASPDSLLKFDLGSIQIRDPHGNFSAPQLSTDHSRIFIEDYCLKPARNYSYTLQFAGALWDVDPSIDNQPN